jgi:hypothetical protein
MRSMSSGSVFMAAFTLVVAALLGTYLGYNKASAAPGGGDITVGTTAPTVNAKAASAIPEGPVAAAPDEAFIRKIAQQEIQNSLHPKKPAVAKASTNDDDDDDSDDHGQAAPPPVSAITPVPAPVTPATPPVVPPPPKGLY